MRRRRIGTYRYDWERFLRFHHIHWAASTDLPASMVHACAQHSDLGWHASLCCMSPYGP